LFSITVRDHVMIAHSFRGEAFGPAQRLHGATYVVDVEFRRAGLDADGVVIDIGAAAEALKSILSEINYRNLDEVEAFAGRNTTTEFLAKHIFERMVQEICSDRFGAGGRALDALKVTLHESHVASASYEQRVSAAGRGA
jgi:6-pyruvoyl-tetrahydropterin synthase